MKRVVLLLSLCAVISSCFKDEPLSSECDIIAAEVDLDDWSTVFYHASDINAVINEDFASSTIKFANTLPEADLTAMAPVFTISAGATIVPASGTVRDFSQGGQEYVVTSANGSWSRTYTVRFVSPTPEKEFHFEDYSLSDDGKYYVWGGDWATANPGFSVANSNAKPEDYPTVPEPNGVQGACVRLTTASAGALAAMLKMPLAAGNIFIGDFDLSTALTNTLQSTHFGVPFNEKPTRLQGWYKYSPGAVITDANGEVVPGEDTAAIYARLYINHDAQGNSIVLNGEDISTNANIIARADVETTVTADWIYFDTPFIYSDDIDLNTLDRMGYSLVIAACASSKGDHYEGAVGSTLYVDEFVVVTDNDEQ